MKNKVVFAAAGNGKTYNICKQAIELSTKTNKFILIVTYTHEGVRAIETEYRKQNFGVINKNVIIKTWYSFLLSDLIKPYQCLLKLKYKRYKNELEIKIPENLISSIAFYQDEPIPRWYNSGHVQYYLNGVWDIRKDNVSNLACLCISHSKNKVISRLEEIYDYIFFDELQDYAGYDLEVFLHLFSSQVPIQCVGDYKQSTFRTNNSVKNSAYRDEKIKDFFVVQQNKKTCEIKYNKTTRRFNQSICSFVNTIHNDIDNMITTNLKCIDMPIENTGVYIISKENIEKYCKYYFPTILRYDKCCRIPFEHNCDVFNYGASKGATFERVVIIPVGTVIPFIKNQTPISSAQTRSKFFVACTRAKHSVVFVLDNCSEINNYQQIQLTIGDDSIPAYKFIEDPLS